MSKYYYKHNNGFWDVIKDVIFPILIVFVLFLFLISEYQFQKIEDYEKIIMIETGEKFDDFEEYAKYNKWIGKN